MMTLPPARQLAYRFFGLTLLLLIFYVVVALLSAVKFLPQDPLATSITYAQASAFANALMLITLHTGLLAGGVYLISVQQADGAVVHLNLLRWAYRAWTILIVLVILAGLTNQLDGRHMLELPPLLDVLVGLVLGAFVVIIGRNSQSAHGMVWCVGMGLVALCSLAATLPVANFIQDRILRILIVGLTLNVGLVLAGVALGWWLMARFSNVPHSHLESGLYTAAGLLAIAGSLVTVAPLQTLDDVNTLGGLAFFVVPLCYMAFISYGYRALTDRNATQTLSAQWFALSVLLLFIGVGIIGAITAVPAIQQVTQGTRLTDLQVTMTAFGIIAMILSLINQGTSELRAENQRVTGPAPFWLVTFGLLGGGMALAMAGVVQVYMERLLTLGYLDTQSAIIPLYIVWLIGWLAVAAGVGLYVFNWRLRAVPIRD